MSSREKKLLIFFLTAIFAVVNMFGFQWLQMKRLSVQQEIVVAAVGQQTGLGILQAYSRQEEEARQRLERNRMNRF